MASRRSRAGLESKASGVMMPAAMASAAAAVDTMNCFMGLVYAGSGGKAKDRFWHLWHLLHPIFQRGREEAQGLKKGV
nr:MAG TPA: hypothetical protein [Caudoviricetes sp.]